MTQALPRPPNRPVPLVALVAVLLANHPASQAQTPLSLRLSPALAQAPVMAEREPASASTDIHQASNWQPGSRGCSAQDTPPWSRLSLGDALAHTLCRSPALRQALAEVGGQRAEVDISRQAYWPKWNLNGQYSRTRDLDVSGAQEETATAGLNLSWVLLDFGRRSANLRSARQTLSAALANQDNALLEAVRETVRQYGEAQVADASLRAAEEAEAAAALTAAAAQARQKARVSSMVDQLQAETALAQATLERVRAQSNWANARGQLALALGAEVEQPLRLVPPDAWAVEEGDVPDLATLREEARQQHPRLRGTLAQAQAARAQLDAAVAESVGDVSFSAGTGNSRYLGENRSDWTRTSNVALVANIPIFNGSETRARKRQLQSQIDAREAEYELARREVENQLWQAHQAMKTSRQSLLAARRLLESANATLQAAQARYRSGAGTMQALLEAQSAMANARRQQVSALVEQLTARTQLSLATGRLGPIRP